MNSLLLFYLLHCITGFPASFFQLQSLQINLLVRSCTIKNIPNSLLAKPMLITSEPIIKFNISGFSHCIRICFQKRSFIFREKNSSLCFVFSNFVKITNGTPYFLLNKSFTNLNGPHKLTLDRGPCFGCQYFLVVIYMKNCVWFAYMNNS